MTTVYPPTFKEVNPAGDVHIQPEDIADYAQQPGEKSRYTEAGFKKAVHLGLVLLTPEMFGAVADEPGAKP
jgi:hypothetical protein